MSENKEINFVLQDEPKPTQPVEEKTEHVFCNFDEINDKQNYNFNIKVIGIGGAGCNVIKHINDNYPSVVQAATLYALNTDLGSLQLTTGVKNRFLLNKEELKGYGSGSDPEIGRQAVVHDAEIIKNELKGTDILFVIAGLGKGAGSGGAPEIAKIAKELGILTVALVNMPSIACEGNIIFNNAFNALQSLVTCADSITTISNEKIISNRQDMSFYQAYSLANDEIANIIEDIISIIYKPTAMNIDFADLRTFFKKNKFFMMNRVGFDATNISEDTIKKAMIGKIKSSFSDVDINKAKMAICNISMSKKTPTTFTQNINRVLAEYTNNACISLSNGIDYNDSNQIDVSFLISGNNSATEFGADISQQAEDAKWHEPTGSDQNKQAPTSDEYDDFLKEIKEAALPTKDINK